MTCLASFRVQSQSRPRLHYQYSHLHCQGDRREFFQEDPLLLCKLTRPSPFPPCRLRFHPITSALTALVREKTPVLAINPQRRRENPPNFQNPKSRRVRAKGARREGKCATAESLSTTNFLHRLLPVRVLSVRWTRQRIVEKHS